MMRGLARSFSRRVTSSRLRVLAYHEVTDAVALRRQLEVLRQDYSVVDGATAVGSLTSARSLPTNAVWITFDDGYRSVVERALPLLEEFEMPGTLFVNPGVIEAGDPHWWDLVEAASVTDPEFARPLGILGSIAQMKSIPDSLRRDTVELARSLLSSKDIATIAQRVADRAHLDEWTRAGMQVGNHTWDHPCFDMCSPTEQEFQIVHAATWLIDEGYCDGSPPVFAYPNGDRTDVAEWFLSRAGAQGACLFDHRLVSRRAGPMRISRLRISASASVGRFKDIISGAHPAAFGTLVRLGRRQRTPKLIMSMPRTASDHSH